MSSRNRRVAENSSTGAKIAKKSNYNIISKENLDDLIDLVKEVVENRQRLDNLLELRREDQQLWMDALQLLVELPDRTKKVRLPIVKLMLTISRKLGLCPQRLVCYRRNACEKRLSGKTLNIQIFCRLWGCTNSTRLGIN
ncbi:hypothetical protein L218DRAFT_631721 [Marasmius fiardii PR-910]|nr:hypothetical protein L218DRAFT_631721 [Marasmius fiardii PR-910]